MNYLSKIFTYSIEKQEVKAEFIKSLLPVLKIINEKKYTEVGIKAHKTMVDQAKA